jgi:hypothetical protein
MHSTLKYELISTSVRLFQKCLGILPMQIPSKTSIFMPPASIASADALS